MIEVYRAMDIEHTTLSITFFSPPLANRNLPSVISDRYFATSIRYANKMADSMDVDKQPTPEASGTVTKGKGAAGGKDDPRFVVKKVSH
jgi:hypothetical protein